MVSVPFPATMSTLERLAASVRLALLRVDVQAPVAGLAGIGGRNQYHRHSSNGSLVGHKHPELVERPVIGSTAFSFTPRFLIQALSDACQVLKSQCCTNGLGIPDQGSADVVVQPCLIAPFPPRKPTKQSSRRPRAFGLNLGAYTAEPVTDGLDVFSTPRTPVTSGGYIPPAQVNSDYLWSFASWGSVQLNRNVDVVLPLPGLAQSSTCWFLPSQKCYLIAADLELEPNPSTHQCYTNSLFGLSVLESAHIQSQAGGAKLVDLFHRFGVANHTAECLTDVISLQPRCRSYRSINQVMQLGDVPALFTFSGVENLVAGVSKSLQGAVNLLTQLLWDYQLATYRDGLAHGLIVAHPGFAPVHLYGGGLSSRHQACGYGAGLQPENW